MARGNTVEFASLGPQIQNGFDLGGARIYPWSTGLAITPPTEWSNYIGDASGLPTIAPPVAAQAGTTGVTSNAMLGNAVSKPFGRNSPLPWVIGFLFLAVVATHMIHYK